MATYIIELCDLETSEPVRTEVIEAANDHEACVKAAAEADRQGYELGAIVRRD